MKKIDLNDITFCIPVRIESAYRRRNLQALLGYTDRFFDTNYIVLEADVHSLFDNEVNNPKINHVFVKDENAIFHRTKYINQMIKLVRTPYAAIWDTDAIVPVEQIERAYHTLQQNEKALVYPFSGMFIALNEFISADFYRLLDLKDINDIHLPSSFIYGFYSVGGAYMIHVDKYLAAGGENEHFYGWGPEDAERHARIQILEAGVEKIEGSMYHLYHTRGINSRDSTMENAMNNKNEFCKICGMTKPELQHYIGTWNWR